MRKTVKDNPADRIVIDVNSKGLRLERWDDEVDFEITPASSHRVDHYEIEPNEEQPEGGYEFSTILETKPRSNKIQYAIKSKGVAFHYQPELTQEEIDNGAHRPEHVVGSYAVYASEPKRNIKGGKLYRNNKVGHIYRPKIIDANGNWVWGEMEIKGGKLTITIPWSFLDGALYPVIVDPTVGYDTAGGSNDSGILGFNDFVAARIGVSVTLPESGTLDAVNAYLKDLGDDWNIDMKAAINERNSGGADSHGELEVKENTGVTSSSSGGWETFTMAGTTSLSATDYILNIKADRGSGATDDNAYITYDTDESVTVYDSRGEEEYNPAYDPLEDPWTMSETTPESTEGFSSDRRYSIYATYTAASEFLPIGKTRSIGGMNSITYG